MNYILLTLEIIVTPADLVPSLEMNNSVSKTP